MILQYHRVLKSRSPYKVVLCTKVPFLMDFIHVDIADIDVITIFQQKVGKGLIIIKAY